MPESQPAPQPPPANTNPFSWIPWGLKWATAVTPERLMTVLLVTAVGIVYYDLRQDKILARQEAQEMVNALKRELATNEERNRQDKIATGTMILKHCADQNKIGRDEEAMYRKDMIAVQNKLADAVNALTKKVSGMKDVDGIRVDP